MYTSRDIGYDYKFSTFDYEDLGEALIQKSISISKINKKQ